jgi:hypothetical protein
MESITILRELWRLRYIVALGGLLALAIALMTAYRVSLAPPKLESRQYQVGVASARMLIDTPASQVVELNPKGADTLSARASLLANLMVSSPVKAIIARNAGIPVDRLVAIAPAAPGGPTVPTPLSQRAAEASKAPGSYLLTLQADETLPIISIEAQAPNAGEAARLANATTAGLRDYLRSVAGAQNVPAARQIVVSGLGAAQAADVVRGPRHLFAIAAFILVFGFACFSVIMISGISRGWRRAAALERAIGAGPVVEVATAGAVVTPGGRRRPRSQRSENGRSEKAVSDKPSGSKRATGERAGTKRASGERSDAERAGGENPTGGRSDGERPGGERLAL